ncbi:C1 family peptidase [Bauldia sp.]|uniref:C1 family peptidase n=1 Tax=Bauldia sp. TaxID=2575872 RepID=UPI003BA9FA2E
MPYTLSNCTIQPAGAGHMVGTGWVPPMVDPRDFTDSHPKIAPIVKELSKNLGKRKTKALRSPPRSVDLRPWCSPIEDQLSIGSCTAHAAVGIVEYFQRRAFGKHLDGSRLFVYKATRNIMGVNGDTGAWLRNAMGALVTCGVPTERYWPYNISDFDIEPPPFVYAVADNFEAVKYFSHDPLSKNVAKAKVVQSVKKYLALGIPAMFGFWGYGSFDYGDQPGHVPLPTKAEHDSDPEWGHAVVAVGYDDSRKITNTVNNETTTGALLLRNSWGLSWGDSGYGWMPYDYVLNGLAMDFWSLLKMEWVDAERFY